MKSRSLSLPLATALAVAALATPASAMPAMDPPTVTDAAPAEPPAPVVVDEGGFDWGSAGLGTAAGLVLAGAGALVTTRGRFRIHPSP